MRPTQNGSESAGTTLAGSQHELDRFLRIAGIDVEMNTRDSRPAPRALMPVARCRSTGPSSTSTPALAQVLDRLFDRPVPAKAQVAVPRPHRIGRPRVRLRARPVDVQLLLAEAVGEAPVGQLDELGAEHIGVEAVRTAPSRRRRCHAVV